ncbi:ZIP family metal transporter [Candidatus Peregrinibacteria bacterium]|nr:ZIP family metal transporter [Candidatus Peregrinibacteria bacterium]
MLSYAFISATLISLVSFSGALALLFQHKKIEKILLHLVAFSAGTMMAGALFHLLPEALAAYPLKNVLPFGFLIIGFSVFFILERFIFWHHCHRNGDCEVHPVGYMSLIGDAIHNFLDGVVLIPAFFIDTHVGIATTIAIIAHEIPQEIGDFGVLLHAGMEPAKALFLNFLSAVFAILGVFFGWGIQGKMETMTPFLLAFTAGGFLYISASDLVPELHKEKNLLKATFSFLMFAVGILLMMWLKLVE